MIKLGEWIILKDTDDKIWIRDAASGEAMRCDEAELAAVIGNFYRENF